MKQGQASTSHVGSTKVEPRSRSVNEQAVADIGVQHHNIKHVPMYEGRGLEAPRIGNTIHHCGSQGKHK